MRVFRVIIDCDGKTTKVPGTVTTEIERTEMIFGANSIGEVFNTAIIKAAAMGGEIMAVIEIHPAITILP